MVNNRLKRYIKVPQINLLLNTSRSLNFMDIIGVRGYFGRKFFEHPLTHNHIENHLKYSYPCIQYKLMKGQPFIIGLAEGAEIVVQMATTKKIILKDEPIEIMDTTVDKIESRFGISEDEIKYSFLFPWLALNENNYRNYLKSNRQERKNLLENILKANLISLSKGLGYTVPGPIKARIIKLKEIPTSLKGNPMLGFVGNFSVNFAIPDYWGIGKSVSRGFGTLIRTDNSCS